MPPQDSGVVVTLRRHSSSQQIRIEGTPVTSCRRRGTHQIVQFFTSLAAPVDENDFAGFGGEAGGEVHAEGAREEIRGIGRRMRGMGFAISQSGQEG